MNLLTAWFILAFISRLLWGFCYGFPFWFYKGFFQNRIISMFHKVNWGMLLYSSLVCRTPAVQAARPNKQGLKTINSVEHSKSSQVLNQKMTGLIKSSCNVKCVNFGLQIRILFIFTWPTNTLQLFNTARNEKKNY